ncbi:MAG: methylmalonyl-CoA/ethylmalonyl-CoA epimerase [Halioglobus sp.]|jgi:methylmalonyl-CoA/ethylmalonyl-CoA epimerase
MFNGVHHINFLVRDLKVAVERYRTVLGVDSFQYGELDGRGVRTARFRVGQTWLVLVQPTDPDSVPGRHLAKHGEGIFLLSLGVDSLEAAVKGVESRGGKFVSESPRKGLENWQVMDLDSAQFFDAQIQLCEE